jgi:Ca2+-binding RTX toxin-like protein
MTIDLVAGGGEFLASGASSSPETGPAIDRLSGGGFVIAWEDQTASDSADIRAQRFDSTGAKVGAELLVDAATGFPFQSPAVAGLPSGNFLIVWTSLAVPGDMSGSGLKGQIYDSNGAPVGGEFLINSTTAFNQHSPRIELLASGGFVVSWTDQSGAAGDTDGYAIRAQIFDDSGAKVGSELLVNTTTFGDQTQSSITAMPFGGFIVSWSSGLDIKAQIFDDEGVKLGGEISVNTDTSGLQQLSSLAPLENGGFVAIWESGSSDGSALGVVGQLFDSTGEKVGGEFIVNTTVSGSQQSASVQALAEGGFLVSWTDFSGQGGDPTGSSIKAQVFDSAGNKVGGELLVNSSTTASEDQSVIAQLGSNELVLSWSDGSEVKARIFVPVVTGTEEADLFEGTSGRDVYRGLGGDDYIDGGAGADSMSGGPGNDIFVVDNLGDTVSELAGEGTDEIRTSLATYSLLGTEVENLAATNSASHQFRGSTADNVLTGGGGTDFLLLQDGGSDTALGGDGNDVIYFGTALSAGDIADGGDGRDSVVLQGNVTVTLSETNLANIESISLQSGANTRFGDTANNFYDFSVTTADGNVPAGQQLIVNGQSLRAGEDFTFDGSAESDGKFLVYGGLGVDHLTGGAGVDVFFFEGSRWGPDDKVDGGGGRDALVISAGSGLTHIEFAADALTSIESISLNKQFASDPTQKPSYELVLNNGNVAPGGTLIVNGFSLVDPTQTVSIDGSGVRDGNLFLLGGAGNDTLIGGDGADILYGAGRLDHLTGGGGADTFQFRATSDSTMAESDYIFDFEAGLDKIDLHFIDADTTQAGDQAFTFIGSAQFGNHAGELRIVDMGQNQWVVMGDTDGDAMPEFWLGVTRNEATPMVATDFLL